MDIISNYPIILGGDYFIGKISDFNVWSRILSPREILTYSLGCNQTFVELSNPENVLWTSVNITGQGSNTKREMISANEFCQNGDESRAMIIVPEKTHYDDSAMFCNQINGELFYPTNEQNLDWFKSSYKQFVTEQCFGSFWVPFVRSKQNKSNFVLDGNNLPQTEINYKPWGKAEPIETDVTMACMIFNVSSEQFVESSCSKSTCAFCQVEEKRLKFFLKTSCKNLNQEYFLIQEKNQFAIYFLAVDGLSKIERDGLSCWPCWTIESFNYIKESKKYVAFLEFDMIGYYYPFGLYTWNATLDCATKSKYNWEPMKFKFNNVSLDLLNISINKKYNVVL